MKYLLICIYLFIISIVYCRSINNKQLLVVEPIENIRLDIASRSNQFYEKRDISANSHYQPHTKSLQYDDTLRLSLTAFNRSLALHLVPNLDLFHPDAVIHQNGISTKMNPTDYRIYRGYVIDDFFTDHWWISGLEDEEIMEHQPGVLGWARIVVRHDIKHDLDHPLFEGTFSIHGDIYHVKLSENYHLTKRSDDADYNRNARLVVYRDSDTVLAATHVNEPTSGSDCGFDQLNQPSLFKLHDPSLSSVFTPHLSKRAPTGCPTSQKVLYMGVAADCTYVKYYQTSDNARTQIINDWNSVSAVYTSTFNIGIGLINITLMDPTCPTPATGNWNQACSTSYSISSRLSDFSRWRGNIGNDGAGLWHLMTNCATGPEVGIAWLSQVCNTGAVRSSSSGEYTSGTGVSSIIRDEWKVVAHEIGHGFGAIHDCTATTCPCSGSSCNCCPYSSTQCDAGGLYFMNPTSNASSSAFSPCSISTICGDMSAYTSCLQNPGSRNVTTLQMCGNGIVESGEQCDTGGIDSACCDAATCRFKTGATCDDANDLCCNNCQIRPANYTCRPSSGECDLAEVCDGISAKCPDDKFKDDLTDCSSGLKCASGQCTSRDVQCRARGVSYNISKACESPSSSCSIDCQAGFATCIQFPGNFIDGTPCGIGGVCKAGRCNTDNFGSNVKNWIDSHLAIFIPVVVVAGLLLLCCLASCCCYSRRSGYTKTQIYVPQQTQPPYYGYAAPPQPQPQGWVDPTLYNGPGQYQSYHPQAPAPAYSQRDPNAPESYEMNNANQWPNNTASPPPPTHTPSNIQPPNMQSPSTQPPNLPPHRNERPYNEGII